MTFSSTSKKRNLVHFVFMILVLFTGMSHALESTNLKLSQIDKLVKQVQTYFKVPGVAIGIIENGKVTLSKGYGLADIESGKYVDEQTVFKIASNSKAFTSASLAILVDQGKLSWSDKVVDILPEFKMYDPWVTQEFNIRDLLTHRSGLRIGAGDLMLWPEPTKFSRSDVVNNLQFLRPVASFRDEYAYDNLLYIVAGEVVAKISGMSWEGFVQKAIFNKLGMQQCYAGGIDTEQVNNVVAPHAIVDGKLKVLTANRINNKTSLMAAAGGIKCSVHDLLTWANLHLHAGVGPSGHRLFSKKASATLWQGVTRLPIASSRQSLDKTNFRSYALGWRLSDYHGEYLVSHTGTLSGSMSQITLLPNRKSGVVILTNQQSSYARSALARGILDLLINRQNAPDWTDYYLKKKNAKNKANLRKENGTNLLNVFHAERSIKVSDHKNRERLGSYTDAWFGEVSLKNENGIVRFSSKMSPRMTGKVFAHSKNRWWVKWDDRSFDADAWLDFSVSKNGTRMTMQAISRTTDFSFDFQDLNFYKK